MPDHADDVPVGDDVPRVGDADVGLGLIVERNELHLPARLLDRTLELLEGQLCPQLDALTQGGLTARERALGRDLHRPLSLCADRGGRRDERHGHRQAEDQRSTDTPNAHEVPPSWSSNQGFSAPPL
jgi:hypothetical protein